MIKGISEVVGLPQDEQDSESELTGEDPPTEFEVDMNKASNWLGSPQNLYARRDRAVNLSIKYVILVLSVILVVSSMMAMI